MTRIEKAKVYLRNMHFTEFATLFIDFIWTILSAIGGCQFYTFYINEKDKYGNIFTGSNALQIVQNPTYSNLLLFGLIIIGLSVAGTILSISFIASKKYKHRNPSKWTSFILLIFNSILTFYSIKYFVIIIVIVGCCALGAVLFSSN